MARGCFSVLVSALLIGLSVWTGVVAGSKILMVLPTPSRSHVIIGSALLRGLAERGHEVTMISSFPHKEPITNFRDIYLPCPNETLNALNLSTAGKEGKRFGWMDIIKFMPRVVAYSSSVYELPEVHQLMSGESFDLVIISAMGGNIHAGLAAHFGCPLAIFFPNRAMQMIGDLVGNPDQMASVPHMMLGSSTLSGFPQRLFNTFLYVMEKGMGFGVFCLEKYYYDGVFPYPKYPRIGDQLANVSLVLSAHHFSQGPISANVPAIIEIGGIQMAEKLQPLPTEIQEFLDASEEGVIFFSFGTNLKLNTLSADKVDAIIGALGKVERRVLLKADQSSQLQGLPSNIMAVPWLPQREVLAHPNVKLFISHGGLGSMMESKYYGVPVLGIPIFGDQPNNVQSAVNEGWATVLEFDNVTEANLLHQLNIMLTDARFEETVIRMAALYTDRPMSPMDTAAYWIEYVIRHKGAKHMQSPAVNLNFFQRHSIDVLAFFIVVSYCLFNLSVYVWKQFSRIFGGNKSSKASPKKDL